VRPYRYAVDLCVAVDDDEAAAIDRIHDALESLPGVFPQTGLLQPMDDADVVEDSPLARFLADAG
jgi:hypothetical protein